MVLEQIRLKQRLNEQRMYLIWTEMYAIGAEHFNSNDNLGDIEEELAKLKEVRRPLIETDFEGHGKNKITPEVIADLEAARKEAKNA
jgi:hypothetical protein